MINNEASQSLRAAADLIEQRGKATGVYEDANGCLCVLGALRVAVFGRIRTTEYGMQHELAIAVLCRWLRSNTGKRLGISQWNDLSSQSEVVAGLRAAANPQEVSL